MEILKKSRENLNNEELYMMITSPEIRKMSDVSNTELNVVDWVIYEDVSRTDGTMYKVISILTDTGTYASNSPTFIESFEQIVSCFGNNFNKIKVLEGTSNKGRKFLQCCYTK